MNNRTENWESIYTDLRQAARALVHRDQGGLSLGATGLVHEAMIMLLRDPLLQGHTDRAYLFGAALRAMRRVLVERARKRGRRDGHWHRIPLDDVIGYFEAQGIDIIDLHAALDRLSAWDPRSAHAVTLRYFLRMTDQEVSKHLDVSVATVQGDLAYARAWLRRELSRGDSSVTH